MCRSAELLICFVYEKLRTGRQSLALCHLLPLYKEIGKNKGIFEVPDYMGSGHVGLSIQDLQIYRVIESIIISV